MTTLDILQAISSIVVIFSAIIGLIWTLFRFNKLREIKKSLKLTITPKVYSVGEISIVDVFIELQNTGTVAIFVRSPYQEQCVISAKTLPLKLSPNTLLTWDDEHLEHIIGPTQYLTHYKAEKDDPIILEPGVPAEVNGYVRFTVKNKRVLWLYAEFVDEVGVYWVDSKIINIL